MKRNILITVFLLIMVIGAGRSGYVLCQPQHLFGAIEISQLWRGSSDNDSDTDRFLQAKAYVLEMEWEAASDKLEAYLADFPSGAYRDEALYWLAKSLNRKAQTEEDMGELIALKLKGVERLDNLLETYPRSVWRDDAKALRVEISGQLALMNVEGHREYIEDVALEGGGATTDVQKSPKSEEAIRARLLALYAIADLRPEVAVPILRKALDVEQYTEIRKEALSLLADKYPEEALPILLDIQQRDPIEELREAAFSLFERMKSLGVPSYLNYYAFRIRLKADEEIRRIPEGRLAVFDLPRRQTGSVKSVQSALKDFFGGKASDISIVTFSFRVVRAATALAVAGLPMAMTYREVEGFRVELPLHGEGFTKRYDRIEGKIRFVDLADRKKYEKDYMVDYLSDRLFVMRKGDRCAAFVLQFESAGEDIEIPKEPKYNMYFDNIFGAELRTTRRTISTEEFLQETLLVDYGESRAEIPGEGGDWVLIGHILVNKRDRQFVGRNAILISPAGRPVVRAAEIVVPINDPDQFYVARFD